MEQTDRALRPLRQVRVDLEELSIALEDASYDTSWYLDTVTGEVLLITSDLDFDTDDGITQRSQIESDESGRYVPIPHADSRAGYDDMQEFIDTVRDAHFRELLDLAIQGRGAFRRFKDVVGRKPDELQRWFDFRNRRLEDRAREWLADEGWEPAPPEAAH